MSYRPPTIRLNSVRTTIVLMILILSSALPFGTPMFACQEVGSESQRMTKVQLAEDVRQMVEKIEALHPDPYFWGGGKIAFHRRVDRLFRDLPDSGMEKTDFHERLARFLAEMRDGHTYLHAPPTTSNDPDGFGLPIRFRILAKDNETADPNLYIQRVGGEKFKEGLAGSRLVAIEGVPTAKILNRQRALKGCGNEFGNYRNVTFVLQTELGLRRLVPEWTGGNSVDVTIQLPDTKEIKSITVTRDRMPPVGQSSAKLPDSRAGEPAFEFVDDTKKTAILRLDNTWAYRENFEQSNPDDLPQWVRNMAEHLYKSYTSEKTCPESFDEILEKLPAATDILIGLTEAMKAAKTENLIIDIRQNPGGSSTIVDMLLYFLEGRSGWSAFSEAYSIQRQTNSGSETERDEYGMKRGDYDFSNEHAYESGKGKNNEAYYKREKTTFARQLETSSHEAFYRPPKIFVVSSPVTFSGGFWIQATLAKHNAILAGVPSGQEGNHFANSSLQTLKNSGFNMAISTRFYVFFPKKPNGLRTLPVHLPLTYRDWERFEFDPNASVLLCLEQIK